MSTQANHAIRSHRHAVRSLSWLTRAAVLPLLCALLPAGAAFGFARAAARTAAESPRRAVHAARNAPQQALAAAINEAVNDQLLPAVAFNAYSGEYLAAWEHVYSTTDHDIYAQRVGSDGSPTGSVIGIATGGAFESTPAAACAPSTHECLVVWAVDGGATARDIRARRVAADGSLVGGAIDVTLLLEDEAAPAVGYDAATDEYLIVWEHKVVSGETVFRELHGQRLSSGGGLVGDQLVLTPGITNRMAPSVAAGTDGGYLLAWQDAGTGEFDIRAVRLGSDGLPVGDPIPVSTWEYDQVKPRIAYNPDLDEFLVVWEDHHWGWGTDWDIYGQRITGDGTLLGDNLGISWDGAEARTNPAVAYSTSSKEYVVTWEYQAREDDHDVYRRRVLPDGSLPGPEEAVSVLATWEAHPAVATDAAYGALLVWEDGRNAATTGLDIWGDVVRQYLISGKVFRGDPGDESTPIAGVTVELHCSNTAGVVGALVGSTVTGGDGWYGLSVPGVCEFYGIVEVNPDGFTSTGATSVSGVVLDSDTIQIAYPLAGKTLTGNKFWDWAPLDPPPGPWSAFTPASWVTSLTVTCTVQVQDTGTGLDVSTAQYSFMRNGTDWSGWTAASCTGADGSLGPETITAASVAFIQDSGTTQINRIRFRVNDMGGNTGYSAEYPVPIDTTPPVGPTGVSGSHPTSTWSNNPDITMTWAHATDATSGRHGYSFGFTTSPSSLPDTVMDDVDNHIETALPGDGTSWYFHVRAVDWAGNWTTTAAHAGPYWLDTTAPTAPTNVTSTTHTVGAWSNVNQISVQWTDGTDGASGVAGYSFTWDQSSSTVPDAVVDTVMTSVGSGIVADGAVYFHIRTVDNAGNGSSTVHLGPFYIDTTAPSSAVDALAQYQGSLSFTVSWSGSDGSGCGIASYDIKVIDQYGSSTTTSTWLSGTASTSATYTGARGHIYTFASRARDTLGNLELYPLAGGDAQTTVGRKVLVRVRNESATLCDKARVYYNSAYAGVTDSSGTFLTSQYALNGDTLAALCPVYENPAGKGAHNLGSLTNQNWSWRAYQSSVAVGSTGTTTQFTISNINSTYQDLTVKKTEAVIGFHVLVSVEWDANSTFLNDLKSGLESASAYLYDAGDSQFFWERIEVDDTGAWWGESDIRIHASNQVWPCADVGGINNGSDEHIYMGRYFSGNSSNWGNWSQSDGFRTFIHEFGHYGLRLFDEYLDRNGKKSSSAYCATNFDTTTTDIRASIMSYQFTATEFCSRVNSSHTHRSSTFQDAKNNGESCWESMQRFFKDSNSPTRWTILTPDDRGQIMAGPTALPISDWRTVDVTNHTQSACAPYVVSLVYEGGSTPAPNVDAWIERSGMSDLYQGKTDKNGDLTILGARSGDTEHYDNDGASSYYTVSCSPGSLRPATPITISPDAFTLAVTVTPVDATTLEVAAKASVALAGVPPAVLWQDGAAAPGPVVLAWDAGFGGYRGQTTIDPALGRVGYARVDATDQASHTVRSWKQFNVEPVLAGQDNAMLYSRDGKLMLNLPAGSLTGDAFLAIQDAGGYSTQQGSLVRLGAAYRIVLSSGQQSLPVPAVINLYYDAAQAEGIDADTIRLYHWDQGSSQWVLAGGEVDPAYNIVSESVDHLSVFALLGEKSCVTNGDVNGDCTVNVGDVFYLINYLFAGGPAPVGPADVNGDTTVNVGDVFYIINYLFAAGPAPV